MTVSKDTYSADLKTAVHQHQAGQLEAAEKIYRAILQKQPDQPDALHLLGLIAHQVGRNDEAVILIEKAIRNLPRNPHFYFNLGIISEARGDHAGAAKAYIQAVQLKSDHTAALKNLLRIHPNFAEAHFNLGNVLAQQGHCAEAIQCYQKAIEFKPDYAAAYNNLGSLIEQTHKDIETAYAHYQRAIAINDRFADAYNNLGVVCQTMGRYQEADAYYSKALVIDPQNADVRFKKAMLMLLQGDFDQGWREYEWRQKMPDWEVLYPHCHDMPQWDGSPFAGRRLFVHGEQGFGDTLQFMRYLPLVKARGGTVILEAKKPLLDLLQGFPGIDELAERAPDGRPGVPADLYTHLLSLPRIFATRPDSIPAVVAGLNLPVEKSDFWRARTACKAFKVGIVWAGSSTHLNDHNRSCPLQHFSRLTKLPGIRVFGLQKGTAAADAASWGIENYGELFADFSDTAGLLANLDLIISVDTAVAHLAATMGKPTWLILPFSPDWRWMLARKDSPWYPAIRIFRQPRTGDWEALFQELAQDLLPIL